MFGHRVAGFPGEGDSGVAELQEMFGGQGRAVGMVQACGVAPGSLRHVEEYARYVRHLFAHPRSVVAAEGSVDQQPVHLPFPQGADRLTHRLQAVVVNDRDDQAVPGLAGRPLDARRQLRRRVQRDVVGRETHRLGALPGQPLRQPVGHVVQLRRRLVHAGVGACGHLTLAVHHPRNRLLRHPGQKRHVGQRGRFPLRLHSAPTGGRNAGEEKC